MKDLYVDFQAEEHMNGISNKHLKCSESHSLVGLEARSSHALQPVAREVQLALLNACLDDARIASAWLSSTKMALVGCPTHFVRLDALTQHLLLSAIPS